MTELPDGWSRRRLGDTLERLIDHRGQTPGKLGGKFQDHGVPVISAIHIKEGRIDFLQRERFVSHEMFERWMPERLRSGDVLLTSEAPMGSVALVPSDDPMVLSQRLFALRGRKALLDNRYLRWALEAQPIRDQLDRRSSGTTVTGIRQSELVQVELPLPPLDEQRQIVEILEDHLSRLDAAQSYLFSAIAGGAAMHRGVLQSATRGQLVPLGQTTHSRDDQLSKRKALCPENMKRGRPEPSARSQDFDGWPESWTQVSLEEATDPVRTISYGILKPGPNLDQGVPYVRVINMRGDTLGLDDLHRTSADIARQYERASLVPGDVLLSIRGTYGRVVQVPEALRGGNITQDTVRLAFVGPIDPSFACVYLRSPQAQAYFKQIARGVAVKGVNIGDLRTMPFPIPPLTEQLQIVAKVAELSSQLEDARLTAESGLRRAATLRRSLLGAAFAGRLTGRSTDVELVEEMAGV